MLTVKDLNFKFGKRHLLRNVAFTVQQGQVLQVSGPNGTGKSTLLAILAGLLQPETADIHFSGTSSSFRNADSQDSRANFEYLPAEANCLYLKMDAVQNLSFWMRLRGKKPSESDILRELANWGLNHPLFRQNFPVEKFSTGMKRRLALARLNMGGASCWLLDEPVYGLDIGAVELFRTALAEHKKGGGMAIVVSHDQQALVGLIDQTIELSHVKKSAVIHA